MNTKWYTSGLHFECRQCGRCCSGPQQGNVWVTRPEIHFIADFLKISVGQLRRNYLRRKGLWITIIENSDTKDCIFLQKNGDRKKCMIYPVRPNQCRTWPFWPNNLTDPDAWNRAAQRCCGVNRGKYYSFEEIGKIKKQKKWWTKNQRQSTVEKVAEIYTWLDLQIRNSQPAFCSTCGECCDFAKFDHRLFVTPPELMYLAANVGGENVKPMPTSRCPYNIAGKCTVYKYRFTGCRIFYCRADKNFQSKLSESALGKLKSICEEFQIPYCYTDLATALNGFVS